MLLFLSVTGILLSLILIWFNARKYRSSIYLGGFFFLISLYAFAQYVIVDSGSVFMLTILFIHPGFLFYLIGPMLYLYVRSVLTDRPTLKISDLWHLLPAFIFLVSVIPYLILPLEIKTSHATMLLDDIGNLRIIKTSLLYEFIHPALVFISRPFLILFYAIWSSVLFIRWMIRGKSTTVLSRQRYMIQWLTVLLGFLFILVISYLIAMTEAYLFRDLKIFFTLKGLQLFSGIGLTGLLISPLFFPAILYGLPRIPETSSLNHEISPGKAPALEGDRQKPKPEFEADYIRFIDRKVDRCMEELQPYLQSDCNLAYISKLTGIPAHHLAYYFREERHQSFNDFRNEWRIRHAKKLLREGKAKELTLEAIGLLSGFSTRNTFYTAFKKVEGGSPSGYIVDR